VLNEIETLATNSNVRIVSMRPKPAQDLDYYKRFAVEIETESDMQSLMKFIFGLKNSPQLLKVDRSLKKAFRLLVQMRCMLGN